MKKLPVIPVRRRWALAVASAGGAMALAASLAPAASAAAAAPNAAHSSGTATYHAIMRHATRLGLSTHGLQGVRTVMAHATVHATASAPSHGRVVTFRSPAGPDPASKGLGGHQAPSLRSGLAIAHATAQSSTVTLIHRFNGLSNLDSTNAAGFYDTPPDQGLCVGFDHSQKGSPKSVFEVINSAARETTPSGTPMFPDISLATLYQDQYNVGDPRCLYDPKTASFYFTEIGYPVKTGPIPDGNNTTVDVTVLNAHGAAFYQFDTSLGGNCFGDQPKTGFDNNALIVSTDEYCGPTESNYEGAIVLVISKPQLVAEDSTINWGFFTPVSLGGIPVTGLDPAINTGTGTSYLVNSFPYTAAGNNNAVSNSLGLWKLKGDAAVNTGTGIPTLTGKIITSEHYAFPVLATSTGTGLVTAGITSEAALNPDDSRLSAPVNVTTSAGVVQLWTALDSAVSVSGDPTAVDGAAWFKINTGTQKVASQGYVASKGANVLYPAVVAPAFGPAAMVFTITSPTVNPSAAYTTLGSGKVGIVGAGTGAHLSWCEVAFPTSCPVGRWGDYSWAAIDPGTNGLWMATEYIPPVPDQESHDNWGTYVFKLSN